MAEAVRLTMVANQGEAAVICSLLRAHGIESWERAADVSAEVGGYGGWREVLVAESDLDAARELLEATTD